MLKPAPVFGPAPCGTLARYNQGCRCEACTGARREVSRERRRRLVAARAEVKPNPGELFRTLVRDGREYRVRACPGCDGVPCVVAGGTWLRGQPVCSSCVDRAMVFNGLVSAERARAHLQALSSQGIGRRAVSAASDVAETVLFEIRTGAKLKIRAATERKILAVDAGARADHSLVPVKETRKLIRQLVRGEGLTRTEIARRLGYQSPALQLGKTRMITAASAARIARLHRLETAAADERDDQAAAGPLTAGAVRRLVDAFKDGVTMDDLEERFGVDGNIIRRLVREEQQQ